MMGSAGQASLELFILTLNLSYALQALLWPHGALLLVQGPTSSVGRPVVSHHVRLGDEELHCDQPRAQPCPVLSSCSFHCRSKIIPSARQPLESSARSCWCFALLCLDSCCMPAPQRAHSALQQGAELLCAKGHLAAASTALQGWGLCMKGLPRPRQQPAQQNAPSAHLAYGDLLLFVCLLPICVFVT